MPAYRHLFFDLDRTLWDMDRNSRETLAELFHKYKLPERGITSFELFVKQYNEFNKILWGLYSQGKIDQASLRVLRYRQTLGHFGIKDDKLARAFGKDYIAQGPLKPHLIPGTMETLEKLAPHFKLHIITNGFEEVQHIKMKTSGLKPFFKEIITSEQSGYKKPDPKMFAYALKKCKVKTDEVIMIGDDYEADISGAKKAGWDQIWFTENKPETEWEATHIINSLEALPAILLR